MPRYVIEPGPVKSKTDSDRHYVGVAQLEWLYQIPPGAQRVVVDTYRRNFGFRRRDDDIMCYPRYDGDYPVFRAK